MNIFLKHALCALTTLCLSHRCDGCLDMLLKSLFQGFNPSVEAGPGRLISQHPYSDGLMPNYPSTTEGQNWNNHRDRRKIISTPVVSPIKKLPKKLPKKHKWLPPIIPKKMSPHYRANDVVDDCCGSCEPKDEFGLTLEAEKRLTEFIVGLLKTAQLTPRATLKRAWGITGRVPVSDPSMAATAIY